MNLISAISVRKRDAEKDMAKELRDAGWATPNEAWLLRNALDHIKKTCYRSRSQTRRLRWIARRADLALKGEPFTYEATQEPKNAPSLEGLEQQLCHEQRENAKLVAHIKAIHTAWQAVKSSDWDQPLEEVLAVSPAGSLKRHDADVLEGAAYHLQFKSFDKDNAPVSLRWMALKLRRDADKEAI